MYLVGILSAVAGAAIFFAGWYAGHVLDQGKSEDAIKRRVRKPRPPKCYVVVPGGPDEEQKKKRKKRSASGAVVSADFDEDRIQGTDIKI